MNAQATAKPGWWKRHWKWALPVVLLLASSLLCGGALAWLLGGISASMKSTDVYRFVMDRARNNPEVHTLLGDPIKSGFFITGSIQSNPVNGKANLAIPLEGAYGRATLYVEATQSAGRWSYPTLLVRGADNGQTIDLRESDSAALELESEALPARSFKRTEAVGVSRRASEADTAKISILSARRG